MPQDMELGGSKNEKKKTWLKVEEILKLNMDKRIDTRVLSESDCPMVENK